MVRYVSAKKPASSAKSSSGVKYYYTPSGKFTYRVEGGSMAAPQGAVEVSKEEYQAEGLKKETVYSAGWSPSPVSQGVFVKEEGQKEVGGQKFDYQRQVKGEAALKAKVFTPQFEKLIFREEKEVSQRGFVMARDVVPEKPASPNTLAEASVRAGVSPFAAGVVLPISAQVFWVPGGDRVEVLPGVAWPEVGAKRVVTTEPGRGYVFVSPATLPKLKESFGGNYLIGSSVEFVETKPKQSERVPSGVMSLPKKEFLAGRLIPGLAAVSPLASSVVSYKLWKGAVEKAEETELLYAGRPAGVVAGEVRGALQVAPYAFAAALPFGVAFKGLGVFGGRIADGAGLATIGYGFYRVGKAEPGAAGELVGGLAGFAGGFKVGKELGVKSPAFARPFVKKFEAYRGLVDVKYLKGEKAAVGYAKSAAEAVRVRFGWRRTFVPVFLERAEVRRAVVGREGGYGVVEEAKLFLVSGRPYRAVRERPVPGVVLGKAAVFKSFELGKWNGEPVVYRVGGVAEEAALWGRPKVRVTTNAVLERGSVFEVGKALRAEPFVSEPVMRDVLRVEDVNSYSRKLFRDYVFQGGKVRAERMVAVSAYQRFVYADFFSKVFRQPERFVEAPSNRLVGGVPFVEETLFVPGEQPKVEVRRVLTRKPVKKSGVKEFIVDVQDGFRRYRISGVRERPETVLSVARVESELKAGGKRVYVGSTILKEPSTAFVRPVPFVAVRSEGVLRSKAKQAFGAVVRFAEAQGEKQVVGGRQRLDVGFESVVEGKVKTVPIIVPVSKMGQVPGIKMFPLKGITTKEPPIMPVVINPPGNVPTPLLGGGFFGLPSFGGLLGGRVGRRGRRKRGYRYTADVYSVVGEQFNFKLPKAFKEPKGLFGLERRPLLRRR